MKEIHKISEFESSKIRVDEYWNFGEQRELKMHRIHAYPAKFPHFLIPKAINYLVKSGYKISQISDIFCGCGTSALEAAKLNLDFWGCDINPVATLIAKTKSTSYITATLKKYQTDILENYYSFRCLTPSSIYNHERLNYWYDKNNITQLYKLLTLIKEKIPNGKYRLFYLTAFSNILKPCSRWLTKSIKPQIDPNKKVQKPLDAFLVQTNFMIKSNEELISDFYIKNESIILNKNFLTLDIKKPFSDFIITSPPYVTSYEYADLHQLSSIWLGFANDYRELRKGTIGSLHNNINEEEIAKINSIGQYIVQELKEKDKSKAKSVFNYFIDLERTIKQSKRILKKEGHAFFVIGDTEYKKVKIENAKYLTQCLFDNGFSEVKLSKRQISSKILTPYRDNKGRFSTNSNGRKVYHYEYIILAKN